MTPPFPLSRPSYVDAHVHLRDASALDGIARAGISAVRDAGTREGTGLALLSAQSASGPVVVTAGRALVATSGYGAFLGVPVEGREAIEREIGRLAAAGAAIIKVIASGIVSLRSPGTITAGGFGAGDLRSIAEVARRHGLGVMAHANGTDAIRNAVQAGVRSIEHGFFMNEECLTLMRSGGVFWVPTVGALGRAAEAAEAGPDVHAFIEASLRNHRGMIGRAYELGVQLAVGTDCVLPDPRYGERYREELEHFHAAGIPQDEIERIAVEGGRELLGLP